MRRATSPSFNAQAVPNITKGGGRNVDLFLGRFRESSAAWAGAKTRGLSPEIIGAVDYDDHTLRASKAESARELPDPFLRELKNPSGGLHLLPPDVVGKFLGDQLFRLESLVNDSSPTQAARGALIPPGISHIKGRFNSVAFHQLLPRFSLGGD